MVKLINKVFERPIHFWTSINDVLDYGGGKYDLLTELFAKMRIRNWIYDPFNRSEDHNKLVRSLLAVQNADMAILANVLNVVKEPQLRQEILEDIRELTKPAASVFITVHEGDKSSRGRRTKKDCWQANRPTKNYLREVRRVFPGAFVCLGGKLIYAENRKPFP